jgi:hypothetical protein
MGLTMKWTCESLVGLAMIWICEFPCYKGFGGICKLSTVSRDAAHCFKP